MKPVSPFIRYPFQSFPWIDRYKTEENRIEDSIWNSKSRQLRVDCVGASKGLFVGLFFLTASLLCLVLFFIFAPQPQFHGLGLFLADAAHCTLLIVSLFAIAIGAYRYNIHPKIEIRSILKQNKNFQGPAICISIRNTWKNWVAFCYAFLQSASLPILSFQWLPVHCPALRPTSRPFWSSSTASCPSSRSQFKLISSIGDQFDF